jgi:glutathione S-transferase
MARFRACTIRRAAHDHAVSPPQDPLVAAGPYLLGETFTAADGMYGTTFAMFAQSPMLPKSPVIDDYLKRIVARPSYLRSQAREARSSE